MGLPAFSQWICHFFAELSQVGCRTRGVDGRLVHPALGRIPRSAINLSCHATDRASAREFTPAANRRTNNASLQL